MPLQYGNLRRRALAFCLDWVFLCAWLIVCSLIRIWWLAPWPVLAYFAAMEGSPWQASWGKRQLHLQVIESAGRRVTYARSLLRNGLKVAPWAALLIVLPEMRYAWAAGWLAAAALPLLVGPRYRAWYDWIARTAVICVPFLEPPK